MAIITPFEVVKSAPVRFDFPTSNLCDFIDDVELELFDDKCLLSATYTKLVDNLVQYENVETYDGGETYDLDDLVLMDGCIFVSNSANNTDSPQNETAWSLAPKFGNATYNLLWTKFLKRYLAFNVLATAMAYTTYQGGSKGLTKFAIDPSGIQTVNPKEYFEWKTSILFDSERILRNMRKWMLENVVHFPEITDSGCGATTCDTAPRSRRIAWPS